MTGHKRQFGQIRRLPSKRWQAFYTGPDGAIHKAPSTFTAKIDGEAWLADERQLIERRLWSPPKGREALSHAAVVTLEQYVTPWLADRTLKPRTRDHYQHLLDRLILPTLGDRPLKALTPVAIRQWHAEHGV